MFCHWAAFSQVLWGMNGHQMPSVIRITTSGRPTVKISGTQEVDGKKSSSLAFKTLHVAPVDVVPVDSPSETACLALAA